MADTNPNIKVTRGEWIDLYDQSGIPVGEQLTIENIGVCDIYLAVSATQPARNHESYNVLSRKADGILTNTQGDVGAWAYCNNTDGKVNVTRTRAIAGFSPLLASDFNNGLGSGIKTDAGGTQRVSRDYSLFSSYFTFDVPASKWFIREDGVEIQNDLSTRITSINGLMRQTSGPAPGNTSISESRRHPRYQPDRGLRYSASLGFKDAAVDGVLKAGLFVSGENGAYFKTKGDGKLYAVILSAGVETKEEEIIFPFDIDITLGNIYVIQLRWHGVAPVRFYVSNPATGFAQLVHTYNFLNTLDEEVYFENPSLSASSSAENVTQEVSLWSGSVDVTAEGGQRDRMQYGANSADVTVNAATNNGILAMRSPHTINGKVNTRDMRLVRITLQADKKSTIKIYRTRDPAAIVGGTWPTSVPGSFVEFNSTMTSVNPLLMGEILTVRMTAGIEKKIDNPDKELIDFIIIHGDIIVIALETGSVVTVEATIEYGEEI